MKKLTLEELLKKYYINDEFCWGINTVIESFDPDALYDLTSAGKFILDKWCSDLPQPTSEEIKEEYIRQQTISECIEYFKQKGVKIK